MSAIGLDVEAEELGLVVQRQLRGRDVVAAMRVAEEVLGAIGDPLAPGCFSFFAATASQRIFAVDEQLGAEAAADIRRDDAHLVRRQLRDILAQR